MKFLAESSLGEFTAQAVEGQTYNYWGEFVNMLITLFFILGLIFVTVWFLKKLMRSRLQHLNRSTGIKILEKRVLNPKSSLYLVDVLGKGLVIAESPSGIQLITEFSPDVDIELALDQVQDEQKESVSIKESFAKKLQKLTASKNA